MPASFFQDNPNQLFRSASPAAHVHGEWRLETQSLHDLPPDYMLLGELVSPASRNAGAEWWRRFHGHPIMPGPRCAEVDRNSPARPQPRRGRGVCPSCCPSFGESRRAQIEAMDDDTQYVRARLSVPSMASDPFGLSRELHTWPPRQKHWKALSRTVFQQAIDSFHFYPFVSVIEKRSSRLDQLISLRSGTDWQPQTFWEAQATSRPH